MNTEEKYKILLHKLQESKPVLPNPEEVTQDIMSNLNRKEDDTFTRIIIHLRPWISTAAIFLIGLFIYQQTEVPVEENRQAPIQVSESLPIRKECLQELKQENPDRQSILRTYYCYREQIEQRSNTPIQRLIQLHNSL